MSGFLILTKTDLGVNPVILSRVGPHSFLLAPEDALTVVVPVLLQYIPSERWSAVKRLIKAGARVARQARKRQARLASAFPLAMTIGRFLVRRSSRHRR